MYFSGGSNGGRESLMAIQHWPEDYDGVITLYPAFNWTAKFIKDNRNVKALYANNRMGWLGPKENKLLTIPFLRYVTHWMVHRMAS